MKRFAILRLAVDLFLRSERRAQFVNRSIADGAALHGRAVEISLRIANQCLHGLVSVWTREIMQNIELHFGADCEGENPGQENELSTPR